MERWSPNGEFVASGTLDGRVTVRRAISGLLLWSSTHQSHHGAIRVLAWSSNGEFVASGSDDCTIKIWATETGNVVYTYTEHANPVLAVEWSPDGERVASAGCGAPHVWKVPAHLCEEAVV